MDGSAIISGILSGLISSALFGAIVGAWLDHRLAERAKQLEASASVVDILAEWIRSAYTGTPRNEYLWSLQTTYWKNILLLDKELLDLLIPKLANAPNAPNAEEIIVQARKILLNLSEPDISADKLNRWLPEETRKE